MKESINPCKSIALLLLLMLVAFIPQTASASHYMGGEITVTHVSGNVYTITQKIYRDCAGITLGTTTPVTITSTSPTGINLNVSLNRVSVTDRTVLCPGQVSRCASTSGVAGVEEHVYRGNVTLNPNTTFNITSSLNARNNAITTLVNAGSQNMFLSTTFRTDVVNNSPQFLNLPIGNFCTSQLASLSPNGFDPDGDALVYSLINSRQTATNPVTYVAGFSGLNPLSSSTPITINPSTGQISFTPSVAGQVAVICIRVEEYRNGVKIGEIIRDMQIRLVNCASNSIPAIDPLASVVVPVGTTYCVNVNATDADNNQISLTATSGVIPPGTFTVTNSVAGAASGTFCVTPTAAQAGNTYSVSINATDNSCPQPGSAVRTFNITVPAACNVTINASATPASCGAADGTATASLSGGTAPYQYQWNTGGPAPVSQQNLTGLAAGVYCVTIVDGNSCVGETCVTVTGGASPVQLTDAVVNNTCALNNGSITLTATGGVAPYLYSLNGGTPQSSGLFENLPAGTYTTAVTDASGCAATTGTSTLLDIADATPPTAICLNVTLQLDAYGYAATTAEAVDNGSFDECGAVTLRLSQTDFDCSNLGDNTVTLTVTDGNGNQSTCNATVTVEDNLDPDVHCKPATLTLDASGNATLTVADVYDHDHEACTVTSLVLSKTEFNCSNLGPNFVELTATDNSGNVSTCQTRVDVVDNTAPVALCKNVTVTLVNGTATVTADDVNNGSSDNCGIASLSLSNTTFTCANIGNNTVTLTVTDNAGNTTTCDATVTVTGAIPVVGINVSPSPAVANGLPNTIYLGYGPQSLTLTANGAVSYVWNAASSLSCTACAATTASPATTTSYTVTGTNEYGCTASATQSICVIDARDFDKKGNPNGKVLICHIPPGNPANYNTLSISPNAVPAHLAHGDVLGSCGAVCGSSKMSEPETIVISDLMVKVYPNPFTNQFQVKINSISDETVEVKVFDVLGQLIDAKAGLANQSDYTFGNNLIPGIYMVEIKQGDSKEVIRVVKSN